MGRPRTKRHLLVENAACINVQAFVGQLGQAMEASVRITFQMPPREPTEQTIALTSVPRVPFGGRRWYFICPETGARACRLYLPMHGSRFLSRAAHGLRYHVEHQTAQDADIDKFCKLYRRISGCEPPNGTLSSAPLKKKGMHQRTYATLLAKLMQTQENILGRLEIWLDAHA